MRSALILTALVACGGAHPRGGDAPAAGPPPLSRSGLYASFADRTIAPGLREYTPAYALWSDGLRKRRWIALPPGTAIDTRDPDHWVFPVGTRVFKEFATADGRPLETRLVERVSADRYRFGAWVWRADGSDADWTDAGAPAVLGTDHDVPTLAECLACHRGEPGRVLGYSAVQLAPPAVDPVRRALGYLHANCGSCHYPVAGMAPAVRLDLRLSVAELDRPDPRQTALARSNLGQPTVTLFPGSAWRRLAPGDPAHSLVLARMAARGGRLQMPPIATRHVDEEGLELVRKLIEAWR